LASANTSQSRSKFALSLQPFQIVFKSFAILPAIHSLLYPPPFIPTGRYMMERHDFINKVLPTDFLWPAERELMHHIMCLQNQGFAWDDSERGRFREDFFAPIEMPIVDHKPWVLRNILIPPGIYNEVCRVIH
jgi:hypothetical protein